MGIFESMKKGLQIASGSLSIMMIIFGVNFVTALGMLSVIGLNPTQQDLAQKTGILLFLFFTLMAIWLFLEGGILSGVLSVIKTGVADLKSFLDNSVKFFVRMISINIINALLNLTIWLIGSFLMGIFLALGKGANVFFNILALLFLGITVIVSLLVTVPLIISQLICVANNAKVRESLKAGFDVFFKNLGRFILLVFCLGITFFVIQGIVNIFGVLIGNALSGWPGAIINVIFASAVNMFTGVFGAGCLYVMLMSLVNNQPTQEVEEA